MISESDMLEWCTSNAVMCDLFCVDPRVAIELVAVRVGGHKSPLPAHVLETR